MTTEGECDGQARMSLDRAKANAFTIANPAARARKISVQLSETIFERLEAATDRPGVDKSMVVEAALERFLDPKPSVEGLVHSVLEQIVSQLQRLESDIAIVAETVALHARYHLTVTSPMPRSQQHEACVLGHQRFKALAEQVDRRVRSGLPLMQETIAGLGTAERQDSQFTSDGDPTQGSLVGHEKVLADAIPGAESESIAAVQEDGSNRNFRHLPNAFC